MSCDRLKAFTMEELHSLIFRLDLAETVEPLDELAAALRREMIDELQKRNIKTNS